MRLRACSLILIATCLGGCSSPAWRYALYRLAPDRAPTAGERRIDTPGVDATVTIVFDAHGVPHVRAATERDAAFAIGYMHGRDRRFQLESLRRLAAGRLRELVGSPGGDVVRRLEVFSRAIGLYRDADALLADASPDELALLDAYARGVNHATASEPLPMEFRLLDVAPEPWTPRDSLLTLALVSFGLTKNWEHELGRLELAVNQIRTGASLERALSIWKPRFDLAPHLFGTPRLDGPSARLAAAAPELAEYLATFASPGSVTAAARRPPDSGGPDAPWDGFFRGGSSSNNWAMGGTWTGTGRGAMGSDPHMPHGLPSLGYLAHLDCAPCGGQPYRVIGAGFVGLPGITFGTNGHVAWSATSNWADVTDLYVEKPASDGGDRYLTPEGTAAYDVRVEEFVIRQTDGRIDRERRRVRSTRHGPLVNDFVDRLPADFPLTALRRQGLGGHPVRALAALYRAGNTSEARNALNGLTAFTGHWALSDADGNVAYMPTARLPRRRAHLGTFPAPGWVRDYDWDGFVPNQDIPWISNPPGGFVASANNQVMQPDAFDTPVNYEGDVPNRFRRIVDRLTNADQPALERTRALQLDGTDIALAPLLARYRRILERLASEPGNVGVAATALSRWDGAHRPDSFEPSVWNSLVAMLVESTVADEVTPATLDFILSYFNIEPFVFDLLGDPDNPAWDDRRTPATETFGTVVEAALRDAVAKLAEQYGPRPTEWTWSRVAPFVLEHPFGGRAALAGYLNRTLPTTGSGNTVAKHQFVRTGRTRFPVKYGPVLRVNVDLADLRSSRMSLPGGESGRPASEHYDDLLEAYARGDGASMEMDFERIQATGRLVLAPGRRD